MFRAGGAVLPSADVGVRVIAQRPAVSSSGGNVNEPSSATSTVVPGAGVAPGDAPGEPWGAVVGAGVGVAAGAWPATSGPMNAAVTVTVLAFVVVPSTAIAPLP